MDKNNLDELLKSTYSEYVDTESFNCLAYALGIYDWTSPTEYLQDNDRKGNPISDKSQQLKQAMQYLVEDMKLKHVRVIDSPNELTLGECLSIVKADIDSWNFHAVRQLPNGLWVEKNGRMPIEYLPEGVNPITDKWDWSEPLTSYMYNESLPIFLAVSEVEIDHPYLDIMVDKEAYLLCKTPVHQDDILKIEANTTAFMRKDLALEYIKDLEGEYCLLEFIPYREVTELYDQNRTSLNQIRFNEGFYVAIAHPLETVDVIPIFDARYYYKTEHEPTSQTVQPF